MVNSVKRFAEIDEKYSYYGFRDLNRGFPLVYKLDQNVGKRGQNTQTEDTNVYESCSQRISPIFLIQAQHACLVLCTTRLDRSTTLKTQQNSSIQTGRVNVIVVEDCSG
ncbi:hypothetical protein LSAT2_021723 [Lamellibrachia satsuma]|nr:hypothetical protein LSAT2_021723 [Lamellibrachia satsuma]